MNGNCKDAQPGWGKNEMYPCIYDQQNWGAALKGLIDPLKRAKPLVLTLYYDNNNIVLSEPNVSIGDDAIFFTQHLECMDLEPKTDYVLYNWSSISEFPTDSNFEESNWINKKEFNPGSSTSFKYIEENMKVRSDKQSYWVCAQKI